MPRLGRFLNLKNLRLISLIPCFLIAGAYCTPSHTVVVIIYYYIGYKYKATIWYLTGFPNDSNLGSTV